jgi:hypothetical protein
MVHEQRESGGRRGERGKVTSEGAARRGEQGAGAMTSEVPGEGNGEAGETREDSEDRGEGPSGLSAADKGKGKEKEVVEDQTLQEE